MLHDPSLSPPSSPSLTAIDSSPPSSPGLPAICTPPASPGPKDPFAGSSKSDRRPRIYERHALHNSSGSIDAYDSVAHEFTQQAGTPHEGRLTDATPTRQTRVMDPFSGSAKQEWIPPTYERKEKRVKSCDSSTSVSSSRSIPCATRHVSKCPSPILGNPGAMDVDDLDDSQLTDEELDDPRPPRRLKTQLELEYEKWEGAVTAAIDKHNVVIHLNGTSFGGPTLTYIPPKSIADLEKLVVLPPPDASSSAPPSLTLSPRLRPLSLMPPPPPPISRPFARATTMPADGFTHTFFSSKDGEALRGTPAARAASLQAVSQQPTTMLLKREIQLYLANNSIARLPPELFRVTSLAVLSLRCNALTSVPPQIVQLSALRELNLAQNRLRWLPSEMLQMKLTTLVVSGNPWMPPPATSPEPDANNPAAGSEPVRRPVTDTTVHFSVPPLTEICLRVLLAPYQPPPPPHSHIPYHDSEKPSSSHTPSEQNAQPSPVSQPRPLTVLEASYDLPLTEEHNISPTVFSILRVCVPAAVSRPAEESLPTKVQRHDVHRDVHSRSHASGSLRADRSDKSDTEDEEDIFAPRRPRPPPVPNAEDEITGVSVCPSPLHRCQPSGEGGEWAWRDGRVPVYVHHAEERYTWEEEVAGVRVGAEGVGGVGVPVRWRGCSRGCLSFLDPPAPASGHGRPKAEMNAEEAGDLDLAMGAGLDGDGDVEMEVEAEDLRFEGGLADPADFEEAF